MKLAIGSVGVKADQYSYIGIFIQYLRDILDIIKGLFSFVHDLNKETTTAAPAVEAESTTAAETE